MIIVDNKRNIRLGRSLGDHHDVDAALGKRVEDCPCNARSSEHLGAGKVYERNLVDEGDCLDDTRIPVRLCKHAAALCRGIERVLDADGDILLHRGLYGSGVQDFGAEV